MRISVLAVLALTACATGPQFQGVPDSQSAQVVVYRPAKLMQMARSPEVKVNGIPCDLANGSYAVVPVQGDVYMTANQWDMPGTSRLSFDTIRGQNYYVRFTYDKAGSAGVVIGAIGGGLGSFAGATAASDGPYDMVLLPEGVALPELSKTKQVICG